MIDRLTDTTITERDVINRMKNRDRVLTSIMWFLYLYLWTPIVSLVAWYLGFDFAYEKVIRAGGIDNLLRLLGSFSILVSVIVVIVVGWSLSQYWRFHDKNRRSATPHPEPEAEMAMWHIDATLFATIRNAKIMTLNIDENEMLTFVQSRQAKNIQKDDGPDE